MSSVCKAVPAGSMRTAVQSHCYDGPWLLVRRGDLPQSTLSHVWQYTGSPFTGVSSGLLLT
jgi:hypothetical protein